MRKFLIIVVASMLLLVAGCVNPPQFEETQDVRIELVK